MISDRTATEIAREVAKKSSHRIKHGAVLFKRKEIISVGMNRITTHPKAGKYFGWSKDGKPITRFLLHAEENCIIGVDSSKLHRATLVVCRVGARGNLQLSRPCKKCFPLICSAGIRRIIYSTDDGYWESVKI